MPLLRAVIGSRLVRPRSAGTESRDESARAFNSLIHPRLAQPVCNTQHPVEMRTRAMTGSWLSVQIGHGGSQSAIRSAMSGIRTATLSAGPQPKSPPRSHYYSQYEASVAAARGKSDKSC